MGGIKIDLDWEKLIGLLNRFQDGMLSMDEAIELEPLLEKYRHLALLKRDWDLADELNTMLIALYGYVSGDISEDDYKRISNVV
jgi:hypothetical protein